MTTNTDQCESIGINSPAICWNWNRSRTTTPARVAEVRTEQEIQAVVRDRLRYPGPVLAVGSMHSMTDALINDGGTLVLMCGLSAILGLEGEAEGRPCVRVQAGCNLITLSRWLANRGYELAFQAEIGNATVGALTTGDSKDSTVEGPGYFSAWVSAVKIVDGEGELITIEATSNPALLAQVCGSYGLRGVVVEALVQVQRIRLCRTRYTCHCFDNTAELAQAIHSRILDQRGLQGTLLLPELAAVFMERSRADHQECQSEEMRCTVENFRRIRQSLITSGGAGERPEWPNELLHYRWQQINDHGPTNDLMPRLDFQVYEHDLASLEGVLKETLAFVKAYHRRTGFSPHGWAFHVVRRSDTLIKSPGLYGGGPGTSVVIDPFFSEPCNLQWRDFCRQYNQLAIHHLGARVSLVQTQWLSGADVVIPKVLVHPRFLTPYFQQFVGNVQ